MKRSEADKCIGIAHFSQSNMKQLTKTVKWYWCNKKPTFIELPHVWKMSCENIQSYLQCVETNKIFKKKQLYKSP